MNEFFVTVPGSLGINENSNNENAAEGISDPVEKAVQKFANHPSKILFLLLKISVTPSIK